MNIYVGNLHFNTTEADLRSAFEAYGNVSSAAVIKDKFTGESRGFGFIEMPDASEAKAAMNKLSGSELGGRELTVNEAKPREERSSGGSRGGYSNSNSRGGYGGGRY